jgi:hypothetical protein
MAENKGISKFIKDRLEQVQEGQALPMRALVAEVRTAFPHIKDKTNASVRVNAALNSKATEQKFTRIKGKDKMVYIVLRSDVDTFTKDEETKVDPVEVVDVDTQEVDEVETVTEKKEPETTYFTDVKGV